MALTAAEKQKRYRERMRANNPEKFKEAKLKNAARNKEKKITECTEKEKEILRKQWRNRKNKLKGNIETNNDTDKTHNKDTEKIKFAERKRYQRTVAKIKKDYDSKIYELQHKIKTLKKKCNRLIKKTKSFDRMHHRNEGKDPRTVG
ncbi:hypothetical protein O0L34_g9236 [Tuta absoluta]|nr:hypothetical protein O0L34_g9236 [Tuta absoluta]